MGTAGVDHHLISLYLFMLCFRFCNTCALSWSAHHGYHEAISALQAE